MLVVDGSAVGVGLEAIRIERAAFEEVEEIGRAQPPLDHLADERRDDGVVERVELVGGELGGRDELERRLGDLSAPCRSLTCRASA